MEKDTIGLKLITQDATAKAIKIIRKYNNIGIGDIKQKIINGEYVLLYSYTDRFGLKKIIRCYEELKTVGVIAKLFELDDEPATIDDLKTLNATYDEISDEIDAEDEC